MTISNEAVEAAADGPLYYAKGREVWKRPVKTRTQNGHSVALGFRVCSCGDEIGEGGAATVAQLLSMAETFQTRTDSNEPMGCPLPGACACPAAPHMLQANEGMAATAQGNVMDRPVEIISENPDVCFIEAALSWYDGGPAGDDVRQSWSRLKDIIHAPHLHPAPQIKDG